jgi:hypothetical protein
MSVPQHRQLQDIRKRKLKINYSKNYKNNPILIYGNTLFLLYILYRCVSGDWEVGTSLEVDCQMGMLQERTGGWWQSFIYDKLQMVFWL